MKKVWIWIISILALLVLLSGAVLIYIRLYSPHQPIDGSIVIIDGDTLKLWDSGPTVRLLCVDTPEEGEEGYQEAKNFLEDLLYEKPVTFKSSNYSNDTDVYGRLLRWVYISDIDNLEKLTLVNKLIIDEGYGEVFIVPPETCEEVLD
jgi:micrococcal nuclease